MRKLSKYEKETIINWNEGETIASIYTFNASLKRRLEDFSRKYPLLCRLERSTPEGCRTDEGGQAKANFCSRAVARQENLTWSGGQKARLGNVLRL